MVRKKVVITGAAGGVIGRILPILRELYDLVLLDIFDKDRNGNLIDGIHLVDLVKQDRNEYRHLFKGADVVIHTAYTFSQRFDSPGESSWIQPDSNGSDLRFKRATDDVQMAYNVYRMALEENIKRAVIFSSNHASDYYEQLIKKGVLECIDEDMVPYSDNFYGWSKICEEAMGHMFAAASESPDQKLEVIMIRVGAPRTDLIEKCTSDDYYRIRRHFGSYLSINDEIQLVKRCIETDDIRDKNGVPFLLIYATSDNYNRIWSLRNARQMLGYEPEDSSYRDFPERIKMLFNEHIDNE
jgi:hypothetical protein